MDMTMGSAVPGWLEPVAWVYLALALASAALIAADIHLRGHRHGRISSELVWIASGLYLGPGAVVAHARRGRRDGAGPADREAGTAALGEPSPLEAVLPGGGASAVAHLVAVPLVAALGWTIAGMDMWPMIIVIALLAVGLLTVLERTGGVGRERARVPLGTALVAAVVTVAAFDVGMVGWMLLLHFNDLMPPASEATFWFLMQVGVIVGLATGYPAVKRLSRSRSQVAVAV